MERDLNRKRPVEELCMKSYTEVQIQSRNPAHGEPSYGNHIMSWTGGFRSAFSLFSFLFLAVGLFTKTKTHVKQ